MLPLVNDDVYENPNSMNISICLSRKDVCLWTLYSFWKRQRLASDSGGGGGPTREIASSEFFLGGSSCGTKNGKHGANLAFRKRK